eukprot:1004962-Pleurochrysis_carterae.AAC.13
MPPATRAKPLVKVLRQSIADRGMFSPSGSSREVMASNSRQQSLHLAASSTTCIQLLRIPWTDLRLRTLSLWCATPARPEESSRRRAANHSRRRCVASAQAVVPRSMRSPMHVLTIFAVHAAVCLQAELALAVGFSDRHLYVALCTRVALCFAPVRPFDGWLCMSPSRCGTAGARGVVISGRRRGAAHQAARRDGGVSAEQVGGEGARWLLYRSRSDGTWLLRSAVWAGNGAVTFCVCKRRQLECSV